MESIIHMQSNPTFSYFLKVVTVKPEKNVYTVMTNSVYVTEMMITIRYRRWTRVTRCLSRIVDALCDKLQFVFLPRDAMHPRY